VGNENLRVELFGNVRSHQSAAMNYQLQEQLKGFDKEFKICGGHIGSSNHKQERQEFAKTVSKWLLNEFSKKDYDIGEIETTTEFNCHSLSRKITVETKSTFGDDTKPVSSMPFYEPN